MRKLAVTSLKVIVTVAILAFIIRRYGLEDIFETLQSARPLYLLLAVVIFVLSGILGSRQWMLLLHNKGITLTFVRAVKLYFMGMFFNNFIFGTAAADAVRVTYVKLSNEAGKGGFAATFLDRFAGLCAMLAFAIVGSGVLLQRGMVAGRELTTAIVALLVTSLLFLSILGLLVSRRLQKWFFGVAARLKFPGKQRVMKIISEVLFEVDDRPFIAKIALLSALIQIMRVFVHVLCGAALGVLTFTNFQYFFIFVPILAMVMIIPMPFGVKEGLGGTLFALAGFKEQPALVMEFLASLVGIIASMAGGIFFVTSRGRIKQASIHP
ncbi:MAG: flippase-like domain-containing protein [Chitinivibrionales bacterium]|nr:flippase-like domain-containing protein [Chitinivibrionales bacterium]